MAKSAKKRRGKVKHIPKRTCVGCHEVNSKFELIRIVRLEDGVAIDLIGKLSGRGAYLHRKKSCWDAGLKGSLEKALKVKLSNEDRKILTDFAKNLPDE